MSLPPLKSAYPVAFRSPWAPSRHPRYVLDQLIRLDMEALSGISIMPAGTGSHGPAERCGLPFPRAGAAPGTVCRARRDRRREDRRRLPVRDPQGRRQDPGTRLPGGGTGLPYGPAAGSSRRVRPTGQAAGSGARSPASPCRPCPSTRPAGRTTGPRHRGHGGRDALARGTRTPDAGRQSSVVSRDGEHSPTTGEALCRHGREAVLHDARQGRIPRSAD
ncbi:hypothetical protein DDQ41_18580 [Streptomyces spongiicola]|uniref:Uncharacterized protein n=1 Tax=Streptomyces spongiicola TaxID=1690221 RepID=A0ABN5KLH4_9ACTN|nr:hypothetical protein DDQ41_18580 [Streptomyces spongiicola]